MTVNHLSTATSPYLLQHAHNPVNWYPWGEEALQRARDEDKPIFLSIGYAACHWCHVMAHESFEDPQTAALMNQHYVCIKVDREERPDLDAIYMQATTALTGSGGWPMSVFLTPSLHPFYAGTYFPPEPRHGLSSFQQVLSALAEAWQTRRDEIHKVGSELLEHLQAQASLKAQGASFTSEMLVAAVQSLVDSYDWSHGGWGAAPKFPQPMAIEFLLRRVPLSALKQTGPLPEKRPDEGVGSAHITTGQLTQEPPTEWPGLKAANHALQLMARGGMYDVVGGGFARYSTDNNWLVPHFEKMLYDNAQLALLYLHGWQVTREPSFRRVAEKTFDFVLREMTSPEGGFYSSLDADSEGGEGSFYVWTRNELREVLGPDAELFEAAYGITTRGNWEGKYILQRALDDATLAARFHLDPEAVSAELDICHEQLLAARSQRPRPATDDKVLTAWNALMLRSLAEAARLLPRQAKTSDDTENSNPLGGYKRREDQKNWPLHERYYEAATRNARFLLSALRPDGKLRRAWRAGQTGEQVFLDDYAALIIALLELYQTDFDNGWFVTARELADEMLARFGDPAGGFFDTPANGEALPVRPKDVQDNATPSGNALACEALLKLAAFTGNAEYRSLAENALELVSQAAPRYPTAFARWLSAADFALETVKQVAIAGDPQQASTQALIRTVRSLWRPNLVLAVSSDPATPLIPELLLDRPMVENKATAYICQGFTCKLPVTSPGELRKQL